MAGESIPLAATLLCFWGIVAFLIVQALARTNGHFVYALDDAYIHMAIAKNFAAHGVWGLSPHGFANASSSPLWTALLALDYRIFGSNTLSPFIFCILSASAGIVVVDRILRGEGLFGPHRALASILIMLWTPLPALVFTGQEHALHALLTIAFVWTLTGDVERHNGRFLFLSLLLPFVRYEGLFLCAAGAGLLWITGRRRLALLSMGLGCVPPLVAGIVSLAHGWPVVPTSILLKGNLPHLNGLHPILEFLRHGYRQALMAPEMLFLLLAGAGLFLYRWNAGHRWDDRHAAGLALFVAATALHLQLGRVRWFFRYEAYLVALGLVVMTGALNAIWRENHRGWERARKEIPAVCALVLLCGFPVVGLMNRAGDAIPQVPGAVRNIYEQQVQMGLFVKEFYPSAAVAANDIGALSYYSGAECLDLWGLASREVAAYRLAGDYDRERIGELAQRRGCRIALVYDAWFHPGAFAGIAHGRTGGFPETWLRAGEWTIEDKVVAGEATVSFYALSPAEMGPLCDHLREFSAKLPHSVKQSGPYRQ